MPPEPRSTYNIVNGSCRPRRPQEGSSVSLTSLRAFCADESAQGLVEYALVIALVSIVAIASLRVLGEKASNTLSNAAEKLS
jgi:pilus assembly protein Flp/PilA